MYDRVPTKELAMESMSWPLTPKSHSLISPREFTRMLEGFTSVGTRKRDQVRWRARVQIPAAPPAYSSPIKHPFSSTPSKNISKDALHTAKLALTTASQQKGQTCKPLSTSLLLNTGQEEQITVWTYNDSTRDGPSFSPNTHWEWTEG